MRTNTRRERLLNILHRGPTTVLALAQHFGVSERTIYRDVVYLRTEGHDVQATPGPGGGLRILRDSRPRAVHFEVSEIIGLALSVAILKATPHMPFARSAEAALDRACRALSMERPMPGVSLALPGAGRSPHRRRQRRLPGSPS